MSSTTLAWAEASKAPAEPPAGSPDKKVEALSKLAEVAIALISAGPDIQLTLDPKGVPSRFGEATQHPFFNSPDTVTTVFKAKFETALPSPSLGTVDKAEIHCKTYVGLNSKTHEVTVGLMGCRVPDQDRYYGKFDAFALTMKATQPSKSTDNIGEIFKSCINRDDKGCKISGLDAIGVFEIPLTVGLMAAELNSPEIQQKLKEYAEKLRKQQLQRDRSSGGMAQL